MVENCHAILGYEHVKYGGSLCLGVANIQHVEPKCEKDPTAEQNLLREHQTPSEASN